MKAHLQRAALTALALAATAAAAQFVKGNEAVMIGADGTRRVETPPLAKASLAKPCPATKPSCSGGGWLMVQTDEGIQECTEFYARPGTCRASTFGADRRPRQWFVKSRGEWLQCERPELGSHCIRVGALPNLVVQ